MGKQVFKAQDDFSGYTISETDSGFVVEWNNAISGNMTGERVLVKYESLNHIKRGDDMSAMYNEYSTVGSTLQSFAADCPDKILSKGKKVK